MYNVALCQIWWNPSVRSWDIVNTQSNDRSLWSEFVFTFMNATNRMLQSPWPMTSKIQSLFKGPSLLVVGQWNVRSFLISQEERFARTLTHFWFKLWSSVLFVFLFVCVAIKSNYSHIKSDFIKPFVILNITTLWGFECLCFLISWL